MGVWDEEIEKTPYTLTCLQRVALPEHSKHLKWMEVGTTGSASADRKVRRAAATE